LLFENATQTVFGEGEASARIVMIGEQPGNDEDLQGRPFVGPAGKVLDQAIAAAGLAREQIYVTNAVKHFKWVARGKRRLHAKPTAREITACRPWLEAELTVIEPAIVVCLGATAAQAIFGASFRITKDRGKFMTSSFSEQTLATWHPSAILRAPEEDLRQQMRAELTQDLALVAQQLR
jgi:DNA polymerase